MSDYEKTVQKMVEFYKGHTSFAPDYIESKMNGSDWYVYLDEAFQYGLVTDKVEDISVLL
jgi:ATP-dependent protease ClpP protease subunit